jgi:hypothetical protein
LCVRELSKLLGAASFGRNFLDLRYDPPLFGDRRERDFQSKETFFLEPNSVRCAFACASAQVHELSCSAQPSDERRTIQQHIAYSEKGATRQGFTKAQIERFEIAMPPIEAQIAIVKELDALKQRTGELAYARSIVRTEIESTFPSVLNRAFSGHL